ncbi:DUF397 domain-containing protein [Streptomyces sp. RPT161]|uniref:DUF397 domain-containing protein n=1 Tax=Streptomyces sp. RPT161 TaxID=3015993 RepID=UPI0022B86ABA|nr:DUF397 domain-containing protein [Streptomyces sp. RPT161]
MRPMHWTRSRYCDSAGLDCVEVAMGPGPAPTVCVRDSKDPFSPTLAFEPTAWSEFVNSIEQLKPRD